MVAFGFLLLCGDSSAVTHSLMTSVVLILKILSGSLEEGKGVTDSLLLQPWIMAIISFTVTKLFLTVLVFPNIVLDVGVLFSLKITD